MHGWNKRAHNTTYSLAKILMPRCIPEEFTRFSSVALYTHTDMSNVVRVTTLESAAALSAAAFFSAAILASAFEGS
jgi:hypothetical protein